MGMLRVKTLRLDSGVDFDDAEYGFKEEDKPSLKVSPALFPSRVRC